MAVCNEHIIYQSLNAPYTGTFSKSQDKNSLYCTCNQI